MAEPRERPAALIAPSSPLLSTKITIPPVRPRRVERAGLIARLNSGLDGKFLLIAAPAGYGKTTLAVEWLLQLPGEYSFAWLSLDDGDNDPTRFLAYLVAAMQQIEPGFGAGMAALAGAPMQPRTDVALTVLLNEMAALQKSFVLVLDDYHSIHAIPIHEGLAFILDHQPANMHLALITREDPLLPLARLRARGQILEIRQDDLRFTPDETTSFLQEVMGLPLSADDIAALERRTEGWIAGLQLAALSMHGREDLKGFVQDFTGSSRFILDYLMEEVFDKQAPEVKDFLLRTSILERLSAPLCDAVWKKTDSQHMLEMLEQVNLFIIPLDQSRVWYRYHRLFAELLRHRLRLSGLNEAELQVRASQWFETEGLTAEAIQHALAAQDWERCARLIGLAADGFIKHGELVTVIGWCQRMPAELIRSRPELGMSYAWALLVLGRLDEVEAWLAHYEEMGQNVPVLLGQVALMQAHLARARGDNQRMIDKSEQALQLLPETDIDSRCIVSLDLGLVYWHEGRLREAKTAFDKVRALASQTENHYASLASDIMLAYTLASQGSLRRAEELLLRALQAGGENPMTALASYGLAGIYYEWNDLPRAWRHMEQGLEISTHNGDIEFQIAGHLLKARLLVAQGDAPGARFQAETLRMLSQGQGSLAQARAKVCQAHVALAVGDLGTAKQWVEQISEDLDVHAFYRFISLMKARLALAQGEKAKARELLGERLARATQAGWGYAIVAIHTLRALAAETEEAALTILAEGLKLSQPEGFICTYVEAGAGLVPLLQESARRGTTPDYVGQILSAYNVKANPASPLVEPLSEREIEVLRLVTAGMSNREIAAKLIISSGTAKTHIHHLCGKLGVKNRTEAAMRARELGLV